MRYKGEIIIDYMTAPFMYLTQFENPIFVLFGYGMSFIIAFLMFFVIAGSFVIGLTIFPFWILGQIDFLRGGDAGMAIIQVLFVVSYFSVAIPFTMWFFSEEGEEE